MIFQGELRFYDFEDLRDWRENNTLVRTYGFDSNSNRTSLITPTGTTTATTDDQDRLLTYGTNTYTYAPNGETLTRTNDSNVRNFVYDVMGNLTIVSEGSLQLRYRFDAQGRRTQRYMNNQLTHSWLYLDQLRIAAKLKPNGDLLQQFAYGEKINVPSLIIREESGVPVIYRVISDHLGSVRLVVKASDGTVVQRMRYDEFGRVLEDTNPGFQPFGYAGGHYDGDSGLVRFGARDYDPEIGRWLTKDPARFSSGEFNLYLYVDADPINWMDRTGRAKDSITARIEGHILRGEIDKLGGLLEGGALNPAQEALVRAGIQAIKGRLLKKEGKIADALGRTVREIKDAIHRCKRNMPETGGKGNRDVMVDPKTGDVRPIIDDAGNVGDVLDNIFDYLPD
jgi:RHS repeat-associated protein